MSAIRAEVETKDINGEDWDTTDNSAPDVFVLLTCPPASTPNVTQTPYAESYYPEWASDGCMATAKDLTKEPIRVTVFDYDPLTPSDDLVADFTMQLTLDHLSNQREFSITPFQALKAMTFRVTLVEN